MLTQHLDEPRHCGRGALGLNIVVHPLEDVENDRVPAGCQSAPALSNDSSSEALWEWGYHPAILLKHGHLHSGGRAAFTAPSESTADVPP